MVNWIIWGLIGNLQTNTSIGPRNSPNFITKHGMCAWSNFIHNRSFHKFWLLIIFTKISALGGQCTVLRVQLHVIHQKYLMLLTHCDAFNSGPMLCEHYGYVARSLFSTPALILTPLYPTCQHLFRCLFFNIISVNIIYPSLKFREDAISGTQNYISNTLHAYWN